MGAPLSWSLEGHRSSCLSPRRTVPVPWGALHPPSPFPSRRGVSFSSLPFRGGRPRDTRLDTRARGHTRTPPPSWPAATDSCAGHGGGGGRVAGEGAGGRMRGAGRILALLYLDIWSRSALCAPGEAGARGSPASPASLGIAPAPCPWPSPGRGLPASVSPSLPLGRRLFFVGNKSSLCVDASGREALAPVRGDWCRRGGWYWGPSWMQRALPKGYLAAGSGPAALPPAAGAAIVCPITRPGQKMQEEQSWKCPPASPSAVG